MQENGSPILIRVSTRPEQKTVSIHWYLGKLLKIPVLRETRSAVITRVHEVILIDGATHILRRDTNQVAVFETECELVGECPHVGEVL